MKLPDFFEFQPLNSVKVKMGIPQNVYGSLIVSIDPSRLTRLELEKLTSQDGLDISLDELTTLPDGTLAYKDSRVILYIRDVTVMSNRENLPKFHLANCRTLRQMRENKRFERYVVKAEMSKNFNLNIIRDKNIQSQSCQLDVCQNCLDLLIFDGFRISWQQEKRNYAVKRFEIKHFFEKYPRSLHTIRPKNTNITAPLNIYTDNFKKISSDFRKEAGWICQCCKVDLSASSKRKWLHVHHKNGLKHDNDRNNLAVLCISCHAEQPFHGHIKNTPDYQEFILWQQTSN